MTPESGPPPPADGDATLRHTQTGGGERPGGLPQRIGQYAVRRVIASGGMGTVYEALQENPRRPVAVKVMRQGASSESALRRFQYEAQLLARLHHPAIAQIHEAGTHDDGTGAVPFFAMEYIPNARPLTEHATDRKLGFRERLGLFAKICDGVHHGHQKGIVHRDLKPDNILVDSHGQPKIIDFGVARATDSDLALTSAQTSVGQLVGTLQYMSPEQVDADPHDIDVRADVYSLGVVLYALLTGELPYDVSGKPALEAARVIRDEDPRHIAEVDRTLRGDVATIVHKALEKDRDRRYQSAAGLAGDIRRYLNSEAIVARPPSVSYQLGLLARRHRAAFGAVAVVLAVLVVGVAVSTSLYFRSETHRARAEDEAARAMAALGFLETMIHSADPALVGDDVLFIDVLNRYGRNVHDHFEGMPEIEAAVRLSMAKTYFFLDLYEKGGHAEDYREAARDHLTEAVRLRREHLGTDDEATVEAVQALASHHADKGDLERAEGMWRDVVETLHRIRGPDDEWTLGARFEHASLLSTMDHPDAEARMRDVLELQRKALGEDNFTTIECQQTLAGMLMGSDRMAEAEDLYRRSYAACSRTVSTESGQYLSAAGALANMLIRQGRLQEAAELFDELSVPSDYSIEKWFQGERTYVEDVPLVVVHWEYWCPFSQRSIPRMQGVYEQYGDRLQFLGLTQVTRTATEEKVRRFLSEKGLEFPMARESGGVDSGLLFDGSTPKAAILHGGQVLWWGHPAQLRSGLLEPLLVATATGT